MTINTSYVLAEIKKERERQQSQEGWTDAHDDAHDKGQLARAASCYAIYGGRLSVPSLWPWDSLWWKPTDPRRNLIKAAALIVAEIERLDRGARKEGR